MPSPDGVLGGNMGAPPLPAYLIQDHIKGSIPSWFYFESGKNCTCRGRDFHEERGYMVDVLAQRRPN